MAQPSLPPSDGINWDCTLAGRPDLRGLDVRQVGLAGDISFGCSALEGVLDLPAGVRWSATPRNDFGPIALGLPSEECRYSDRSGREVVVLDSTASGLGPSICKALAPGLRLVPFYAWQDRTDSGARVVVDDENVSVEFSPAQSSAFIVRRLTGVERGLGVSASLTTQGIPMAAIGCICGSDLFLAVFTPPSEWAIAQWSESDGWSTLMSGSMVDIPGSPRLEATCIVDAAGDMPIIDLWLAGERVASASGERGDTGGGFDSVALYGEGVEGEGIAFGDTSLTPLGTLSRWIMRDGDRVGHPRGIADR